jgi:hypothetical protein
MIEEAMTTEDWHVNGINVMHDYRERNSEFFDPSNAVWADRITPRPTRHPSAYHPETGLLKYLR